MTELSLNTLRLPDFAKRPRANMTRDQAFYVATRKILADLRPALLAAEPDWTWGESIYGERIARLHRSFTSATSTSEWQLSDPNFTTHDHDTTGMLEEKIIISSLSHPNQGAKLSYIKNTLGVNVVKLKKNEPTDRDAGIISVHDAKLEVSAVAENETDLVKARYSVVFGGWTIDALVNGAKTIELDEPDYDTKVDRIWLQQDYTATPDDIMRLRAVGDFFFNELAMIAGGKMSTAK